MPPRREEFILSLWKAARATVGPVLMVGERGSTQWTQQKSRWAAEWLTPKLVENYDPSDFEAFTPAQRESLRVAVEQFQAVTAGMPADGPQSEDNIERGWKPFQGLKEAVREVVLVEWKQAANALVVEAESWAKKCGWRCRRTEKELVESLLGPYTLPQSELYAEQHLFVLGPIARFVPGGIGSFDLALQPSMFTTTIYRSYDGSWNVFEYPRTEAGETHDVPWCEEAFQNAITELGSLV